MPRSPSAPARPHFVVDGSNIATEGRATPSLKQLSEAVMAFMDEHPDALITVVVDATFGHRIDPKEVKAFDEGVANNELVTPPAGAVGRGDAFVLTIAHKAKAGILSNDSFQEFHGDYPWLFEPGRLIGGKPVPHVGWVFVERLPVRGPRSRQSVKDARAKDVGAKPGPRGAVARGSGSPLADQPLPVPSSPPPGKPAAAKKRDATVAPAAPAPKAGGGSPVNDLLPFLEFVERHPVGTSCTVVIESYASHGAYARAGDVLVYLPLRLMGTPVPRSARSAVSIGDAIAVVIAGYVPERRSIDAALPSATDVPPPPAPAPVKRSRKKAGVAPETAAIAAAAIAAAATEGQANDVAAVATPEVAPAPPSAPSKKRSAKKAAPEPAKPAKPQPPAKSAKAARPASSGKQSKPVKQPEAAKQVAPGPAPAKKRGSKKAVTAPVAATPAPPAPAKPVGKRSKASAPA